ncbi:50S ribosomal protein l9 [Plakobranchus ocellatus]|uniref:Large ribosomal subunit protein bL9m n=1 Tax=Plakobranchus ocellatus TaxID=259542 RepID=A0AAV3YYV4_9GAST|nr:50S ribosomal protein l9 [Plakobranchus ocellatus]
MATSAHLCRACIRGVRVSRTLQPKYMAWHLSKRHKTLVMERVFPLPPGKNGGLPAGDEVNELHKILRPVGWKYYPDEMECILTDFVEGVGIRGDLVKVKRKYFHEELYPARLAVYASPDNIAEFEEERKAKGIDKQESRLGVFARMAMKELNHLHLEVPMNMDEEWKLDKTHLQVAFRLQGIELEEDCLILPEDPITDLGDFAVEVKINDLESVTVKATIVPITDKFAAR